MARQRQQRVGATTASRLQMNGAPAGEGSALRPLVTSSSMRPLVAGCVLLAGITLVIPVGPGFDPWAWLIWGREVLHLDLTTAGGPSWKPLPVLVTTLLAPLGDAAPSLWLVFARASALLGVALAYRLGARLANPVAGVLAGLALVLVPGWLEAVARGISEPLLVALVLLAVESHLDGRRYPAFVFGVLAALVRPEAWPFLLVYGAFLWRAEPYRRLAIAMLGLAVPLLWFGGDWLGSGDPLTGSAAARTEWPQLQRALTAPFEVVALPVWLGALAAAGMAAHVAGVTEWRRRRRPNRGEFGHRMLRMGMHGDDVLSLQSLLTQQGFETAADGVFGPATEASVRRYEGRHGLVDDGLVSRGQAEYIRRRARSRRYDRTPLALAGLALVWVGVVVALSGLGYAGLSRFMFPAIAILCVLTGAGAVRVLAAVPWAPARLMVGALLLAVALPFAAAGVRGLLPQLTSDRTSLERELQATAREAGGRDGLACGSPVISGLAGKTALAWQLDVPIGQVAARTAGQIRQIDSGTVFARKEARRALKFRASNPGRGFSPVRLVGSSGEWRAFAVGCPAATSIPSRWHLSIGLGARSPTAPSSAAPSD